MLKDIGRVIEEIEKHKARILYAKRKLEEWEPITEEDFENPDRVAVLDSFIFRFSKMQDAMGQKLFPLTLQLLGEGTEGVPFIDILARLEKLNLIPSADLWFEPRALRNPITHTYPWETDKLLENLERALDKVDQLLAIYEGIKTFLRERNLLKNF